MARSPWIISPAGDLVFLIASPLAIVPLVSWLSNFYFTAEQISLAVVSFASIGHHLPGFMRAYGDRELFQRFRWRFLLAPPLTLAVAIGFSWYDYQSLSLVLLFWATWHVLMQTYGFMRIYDLKQGRGSPTVAWLDFLLCLTIFAGGVLFSDGRVFGIAEVFWQVGFPYFSPQALAATRFVFATTMVVVLAAYLVQLWTMHRRGEQINWIKLLLVVTTGWLYWTSGAISQDILLGVALFEIFHAIQYNAIVWVYNRGATRRDQDSMGLLGLLFQDRIGLVCLYLAAIAAYGFLNVGAEFVAPSFAQQLARACLITSTILHFYYDGFIWKVSEARTQANLAIDCHVGARAMPRGWWHPLALGALVLFALLFETPARQQNAAIQHEIAMHLHALSPQLPEAQSRLVRNWLSMGKPEAALPLAKAVVERRPKSHQAQADLGVALLRTGAFATAASCFQSAIALNPKSWQNYCDLGTAYANLHEWDAAERSYAQAAKLEPQSATVDIAWGRMCNQRGDRICAIEHWTKALERNEHDLETRTNLVLALSAIGEHHRAEEIARQGVRIDRSAQAQSCLGNALLAAGKLPEAHAAMQSALEEGQTTTSNSRSC